MTGFFVSASRSKVIPLTMKKNGTNTPNATLDSFCSMTWACSPWLASRTTRPATNAPSRMSRPSSLATHTRSAISSTAMRIGSCELESRVRPSRSTTRGGVGRIAIATAPAASATNSRRSSDVSAGSSLVKRSAMATMGRNSPAPPIARM